MLQEIYGVLCSYTKHCIVVFQAPPEIIKPLALEILSNTMQILVSSQSMQRSLLENAAITLGRISLVTTEEISEYLPHFMVPWCQTLRYIRDDIAKEHAFMGLLCLIRYSKHFPGICASHTLSGFASFCLF